jgi:predicted phage gp36 major capsid-like protein
MDCLKTLGDENAVLLRQVEELESARAEKTAAREEMRKFKEEYKRRLDKLKEALKKYAQEYPKHVDGTSEHPVATRYEIDCTRFRSQSLLPGLTFTT